MSILGNLRNLKIQSIHMIDFTGIEVKNYTDRLDAISRLLGPKTGIISTSLRLDCTHTSPADCGTSSRERRSLLHYDQSAQLPGLAGN